MPLIQDLLHKLEVGGGMRYLRMGLATMTILLLIVGYNLYAFKNMATPEAMDAAQLAVSFLFRSGSPTVGASGGIFGLLIAFAMLYPNRMIMPLIPPIPMRAPVFVALYGGLELFLGVTGTQAGVAHFAHLGGLAGGYLFIKFWRRRR